MLNNKKIDFINLSEEQQIVSRKLRIEFEKEVSKLRTKGTKLNSSLSFNPKFENENPERESQLYNELNILKETLQSLHNNHRAQGRSILTENQKIIFDIQNRTKETLHSNRLENKKEFILQTEEN